MATGKDVSDCGFPFKKSITDDQSAETASLNLTALELSVFYRKKQRSKKIKTLYDCIWDQILSGTPPEEVFQPPCPYSLFLEHGSAAKTFISHPHNTASYAG